MIETTGRGFPIAMPKKALLPNGPIFFAGASMNVCVCQGCCCGYFLLLECLGVTLFLSWLTTPNKYDIANKLSLLVGFGRIFGETPSLLHVCRFALPGTWRAHNVPCNVVGPVHLTQRNRHVNGSQILWSTLCFWFFDAAWVTILPCLFITFMRQWLAFDSTWFICIS